jgi:hypothetical protein
MTSRALSLALLASASLGTLPSPAAAGGQPFFIRTFGSATFTDASPPDLAGTMDGFVGIQEGGFDFQFAIVPFSILLPDPPHPPPGTFSGSFTLIGPDPADTLAGSMTGVSFLNDADELTGSGTWEALTGSGLYAGLTGTGSFTYGALLTGGDAFMSFEGALIPAPPAAAGFACLGAALALTRRSRPTPS